MKLCKHAHKKIANSTDTSYWSLTVLREHPMHPMHPLLRTSSGHRRVSFTGTHAHYTKNERGSKEEGEPYSRIEHLRHIDTTSVRTPWTQRFRTNGVGVGGHVGFSIFLMKCRFSSFFTYEIMITTWYRKPSLQCAFHKVLRMRNISAIIPFYYSEIMKKYHS